MATQRSGHPWLRVDLTDAFATWMANRDYREGFFQKPSRLSMALRDDFVPYVAARIRSILSSEPADENSVVAVTGVASLFGFAHLSEVLSQVSADIRGRLLIFFPGEYADSNYRLLDARDGWNYLAVPITLDDGVGD